MVRDPLTTTLGDEAEGQFDWAESAYTWYYRARALLRKYWWILLLTVSGGVLYQGYEEKKKAPVYVSHARLMVSGRINIPEGDTYREEFTNFFGTQIALMLSGQVRQRTVERLQALKPDLEQVSVGLRASRQPDTSIFLLTAEGAEPNYTQEFLDASIQEYMSFRKEMRSQTSESTLLKITEELMRLEEEMDQAEDAIVEFQKKNNLVFVKEQGSTAGSYLVRLKNSLADLKKKYRDLNTLSLDQQAQKSPDDSMEGEAVLENALVISDEFRRARANLDSVRAELAEFSIYMKPKHPKIIRLSQEIERQNNILRIQREAALVQLNQRRDYLKAEIQNLESLIDEWEETALDYSRRLAEFERLNSRLERSNNLHQRLLGSIQSIDLNQNLGQEAVAILENASIPNVVQGSVTRKMTEGGVAGFALGAGILFLIGVLDRRIVSAEDISQRFEQPVLGVIPFEKGSSDGYLELLQHGDTRHMFAEACRNLRSSLLFIEHEGTQPRSFVVTSAVPAEGKSTISSNLAVSLAFASSRTILIDADLRKERLHHTFGMSKSLGLSELIRDNLELPEAVQKTEVENLDFLACGEYPDRPSELLLSVRMNRLIEEVGDQYEYVIFDTAPILATDDTTSFAARAEAVIVTVRSSYTQMRQLKPSIERLMLRGAKLFGFVLNFVDSRSPNYYYYNKYYDYYADHPQAGEKAE